MNRSTKIIIGILLLVFFALVVYAVVFEKAEAPQTDWKTYTDALTGISLMAPKDLSVSSSANVYSLVFPTTTPYVNTHLLHELRIDIPAPAKDCVDTTSDYLSTSTTLVINGVNFERQTGSGVGLGNLYQSINYTTIKNGMCYQVNLFTHSTNGEGFYTDNAEQIKKVDAQQAIDIKNLFTLFDKIVSTIKFSK